ncbi:MAG: hypothetical protein AB7T63_10345 [Planctomycetota bacterium]
MRRLALRVLIASVVASALIGIWLLLEGEFEETQVKVFLTTLCISGASILGMACAPALERRLLGAVPWIGLIASIAGFAAYIAFLWAEYGEDGPFKTATSVLVVGIAATYASLLALARPPAHQRWVQAGAYIADIAVAALVIDMLWSGVDSSGPWRLLGALSILLAAFTILLPILGRLGRDASVADPGHAPALRHCPSCGTSLHEVGAGACAACGARFRVEFTPSAS